jgi:uncharacterized protein YchJ
MDEHWNDKEYWEYTDYRITDVMTANFNDPRDIHVIEKSAYDEALKRISELEAENAKLREALKAVQKHGLWHYEDCIELADEDEACDCGSDKTELIVRKALEECGGEK